MQYTAWGVASEGKARALTCLEYRLRAGAQGHESTAHSHALHRIGEYMDIVRNSGRSDSEKTSTLTQLLRQEEDVKVLECFKGLGYWHRPEDAAATAHFTAVPDWERVLEKLEQLSTDVQVGAGGGGHAGGQTGGHAGGQTGATQPQTYCSMRPHTSSIPIYIYKCVRIVLCVCRRAAAPRYSPLDIYNCVYIHIQSTMQTHL